MSSLRNAIPRRAHKERAQPQSTKNCGLLEKHKDYVVRANAYHKKQETLQRLREKAAFKNPDEFSFKMIRSKTVDGVHVPEGQANKYTAEQRMLMKTQDMGYVLQKLQSEKKKIELLTSTLHLIDKPAASRHVYYVEDRDEAKELEMQMQSSKGKKLASSDDIPKHIKRKMEASYRELEERKRRAKELEDVYMEMSMQKELQKKGRKRKLREHELVVPTSRPVYKWMQERKP